MTKIIVLKARLTLKFIAARLLRLMPRAFGINTCEIFFHIFRWFFLYYSYSLNISSFVTRNAIKLNQDREITM